MPSSATELAEAILSLSVHSWRQVSSQTAEVTESEFLALDQLAQNGVQTVGAIREEINVLPAQMSRIVRRLEEARYITTSINAHDKRKVDVKMTPDGGKIYKKYRKAKLEPIIHALDRLSNTQQKQFMDLVKLMSEE